MKFEWKDFGDDPNIEITVRLAAKIANEKLQEWFNEIEIKQKIKYISEYLASHENPKSNS